MTTALPNFTLDIQATAMTDTTEPKKKSPRNREPGWVSFLRTHRRMRGLVLIFIAILTPAAVMGAALYCWLDWLPRLWSWGFEPASWRAIFSVIGAIYLVIIPFLPFVPATEGINVILRLYAKDADDRIRQQINEAMLGQDELEKHLQAEDTHGLVKLVRYSRLQLQAYYQIGLSQTQRSFRYSVIAMWIGFFVIVAGVVSYLIPASVFPSSPTAPAQQFALLGGLIIELISAAFLWVYKSSINQLTYFYERQHLNHNALLSFGIAESMTDKDSAKLKIVDRLLSNPTQAPQAQSPKSMKPNARESKSDT